MDPTEIKPLVITWEMEGNEGEGERGEERRRE